MEVKKAHMRVKREKKTQLEKKQDKVYASKKYKNNKKIRKESLVFTLRSTSVSGSTVSISTVCVELVQLLFTLLQGFTESTDCLLHHF